MQLGVAVVDGLESLVAPGRPQLRAVHRSSRRRSTSCERAAGRPMAEPDGPPAGGPDESPDATYVGADRRCARRRATRPRRALADRRHRRARARARASSVDRGDAGRAETGMPPERVLLSRGAISPDGARDAIAERYGARPSSTSAIFKVDMSAGQPADAARSPSATRRCPVSFVDDHDAAGRDVRPGERATRSTTSRC